MGLRGRHHALAVLPAGKTRYQLCRGLGGPQGRSERGQKITSTGILSSDRPVHSVSILEQIKNEWIYTSTPPICLLGVDRTILLQREK